MIEILIESDVDGHDVDPLIADKDDSESLLKGMEEVSNLIRVDS